MPRKKRASAKRHLRAAAAVAFVLSVVAATAAGCGSSDGVVGGACASGYTQCSLACFDLQNNTANCGACGHACAKGIACKSGRCENTEPDGAPLEDGSIEYDGNDIELDGETCDFSDPAHPVCRPSGDSSSDSPSDATNDATDDGASSSGGDSSSLGDGNGGSSGGEDGSSSGGNDGSSSGGSTDASLPDGETRLPDGSITLSDGAACNPPYDTASNCGSCGAACVNPNPVCELVNGSYGCAPICTPPLTDCSGRCVDLLRDPDNCGTCGNVCASQYCYLATCQGSTPGNAIILGHDFASSAAGDQETKLLVNSVFYNPPIVRLLSFEHYATAAAVTNAKALLAAAAKTDSYTLTTTVTNDDTYIAKSASLSIKTEDAVIIWDQPNAPTGTLAALGAAWATNLATFQQQGGLVIVLDADKGVGEMPLFLTASTILAVTGHTAVAAGSPADVPLAGLSIAHNMLSNYVVETNTASFTTSETASTTTLFIANIHGQPTQLLAVQKITN